MNGENGGGPHQDIGRVAPVIPLFGARGVTPPTATAKTPDTAVEPPAPVSASVSLVSFVDDRIAGDDAPDPVEVRKAAEESLVRKLRTRSLSVSEARQVLRTHGLDGTQIDDVIDDFLRRRYLDDQELAQMLVAAGVDRKGQGRVAISRSLSQRGIPRDVIAAALDELPDDDAERALEFARTKARSLSRLDHDTALRRLLGQLARRGYGGSVATKAAKTALNEASFGTKSSGVRFVESD